MATLNFNSDGLLIFVDDTGHEGLIGDQRYYGLGGVIFPIGPYTKLYKPAWREVRRQINGDPNVPLHASELPRKPEAYEILGRFFETPFLRFAVTTTAAADAIPSEWLPMHPVLLLLKKFAWELSAEVTHFTNAALIFESSNRADPLLVKYFGQLDLHHKGQPVDVEHCLMPKSLNEPGLEIADFVANAAGSCARYRLSGKDGTPKDFQAVFHKMPAQYVRYMHVASVSHEGDQPLAKTFELRENPPPADQIWDPDLQPR